jgi:hypothetical protein
MLLHDDPDGPSLHLHAGEEVTVVFENMTEVIVNASGEVRDQDGTLLREKESK